jgi:hypothetical protein
LTGAPAVAPLQARPQGKGDTDGTRRPDIPAPDDSIAPAGPLDGSSASPEGSSDEGPAQLDGVLQALLRSSTPVSGAYGSGRLLRTALVSVLMLDDGRVFVGAVTPTLLEQVAADAAVKGSAPSSSLS